jgi:inorganic phosphate transporter, PiT family
MTVLTVLIVLALISDYLNGFNDSSNIVATMISSRAMSPRTALSITAVAEFCGPFLFGVAVAKSIGENLAPPGSVTMGVVLAALIASICWNLITWFFGIPSSSSHSLVGGLVGALAAGLGLGVIQMDGLVKILISLFISPVLGLAAGFVITRLTYFMARRTRPSINWFFRRGQILTGVALALSHGANDAQKTMGIITLGLLVNGSIDHFEVPLWVIALSATAIALGTATGSWRLIRTLGGRFYKIRPIHGFCSQIASAAVILTAAVLGGPVSTTHVVSSAILGVGSAERVNKVRWNVAGSIAVAWLLTIPATAFFSAMVYLLIRNIVP